VRLILDSLCRKLPPIFTLATAVKMTDGLFAAGTLANLDCHGEGPDGSLDSRSRDARRRASRIPKTVKA
jgi:hypothetical protein